MGPGIDHPSPGSCPPCPACPGWTPPWPPSPSPSCRNREPSDGQTGRTDSGHLRSLRICCTTPKFHCVDGVVLDADANAACNIRERLHDDEITLWMPWRSRPCSGKEPGLRWGLLHLNSSCGNLQRGPTNRERITRTSTEQYWPKEQFPSASTLPSRQSCRQGRIWGDKPVQNCPNHGLLNNDRAANSAPGSSSMNGTEIAPLCTMFAFGGVQALGGRSGSVHVGAIPVSRTKSQASRKRACHPRARSPQSMTRSS